MVNAIKQLQQHPAFRQADLRQGLGPLLRLLLEGKLRDLPFQVRLLREAIKILPPEVPSEDLVAFCRQMENTLVHAPLAVKDVACLQLLAAAAARMGAELTPSYTAAADLVSGTR